MGLDIHVGILAELLDLNEEDGAKRFRDQFQKINSFLAEKKFPLHMEPENLGDEKPWSAQMWGYGGLHELRRVAVHLLEGKGVPPPSTGRATDDELLDTYFSQKRFRTPTAPEMMAANYPAPWGFRHLLLHSDCEGFYLPINFKFVLIPPPDRGIDGGMIGSRFKLGDELIALGKALEVPGQLRYDDAEIEDAADAGGLPDSPLPWKRLAVATHSLLVLVRAVIMSQKTGCAIVFG